MPYLQGSLHCPKLSQFPALRTHQKLLHQYFYTAWNINGLKTAAITKYIVSDRFYIVRNINGLKTATVGKCTISNILYAV